MPREEPMINVQNIHFRYDPEQPSYAVDGVSLAIHRGEFVAVLGANGCGKSTLAKHFNAILLPEAGTVLVEGMDTRNEDHLYDVTATVGCIPLIASSIMSKKLAAGSDAILLDVTMGDGAFMKDLDSALELARQMVAIGTAHGRKVAALITDMDKPLGKNIGNSLEVAESMAVLQGKGPADLTEVCLQLASNMLVLAGKGDMPACRKLAESVIADGSAFEKCCQMFAAQGGDISVLRDADKFRKAKFSYELTAPADGYIYKNDVERIGNASVLLGAGRIKKEDSIDFAAGITMHKKLGDHVSAGESICTLYADDEALFAPAEEMYRGGLVIRDEKPVLPPLIYARVTSDGVERF